MKEALISYETAKLATSLGFDWKHADFYIDKEEGELSKTYEAVPQSLLQKWLREVHDINVTILISGLDSHQYVLHGPRRRYIKTVDNPITPDNRDNNWEDTLEKALQEALKLINPSN